jgi:hypothetical protein
MGEAPQALECYQHAAEVADTTISDCDLYTLYAVYCQMAKLFHSQYLPDDEMQALEVAQLIAWKDKDTLAAIKAFELRVRPYFLKEEKDSMIYVMREARDLYLKTNHKKDAAEAIFSSISIYLDRKQIAEAGHWLKIYEKESRNFDENGTRSSRTISETTYSQLNSNSSNHREYDVGSLIKHLFTQQAYIHFYHTTK